MSLLALPTELLLLIIPYLEPQEVLRLSSTCQTLDLDEIKYSASYWSKIARAKFRVQNQLIAEADGQRWQYVYRRLLKQSKVYAWGNNDKGCLGGKVQLRGYINMPARPHARPAAYFAPDPPFVAWPKQLDDTNRVGTISELQCGGWSTTMLTSDGAIYVAGTVDGLTYRQTSSPGPTMLSFPHGFPSPRDRYAPFTAIRQFSTGRCHVLGLSDSGRIWSWDDANRTGVHVKFLLTTTKESMDGTIHKEDGYVTKVVAGWNKSSAYVEGTGIIMWEPSNVSELQGHSDQSEVDCMVVYHHFNIPFTSDGRSSNGDDVVNWIVLEHFVVFVRRNGRAFTIHIPNELDDAESIASSGEPIQIYPSAEYDAATGSDGKAWHVTDVQGNFKNFALLKANGEVLISDETYLAHLWSLKTSPNYHQDMHNLPALPNAEALGFRKYPCLQNTGVVTVAFGDWHFLALHRNGSITSHGQESRFCGALGLGGEGLEMVRGINGHVEWGRDGHLLRQCETTGRRVCFEPEKKVWMDDLFENTMRQDGADGRLRAALPEPEVGAQLSEWIEQRLMSWEEGPRGSSAVPSVQSDSDEDTLPAYYALSVAAAGWHSGALVLVNEAKAERIRSQYWQSTEESPARKQSHSSKPAQPSLATPQMTSGAATSSQGAWIWQGQCFPRLRLISGEVRPGSAPIDGDWEGPPEWKEVEVVT